MRRWISCWMRWVRSPRKSLPRSPICLTLTLRSSSWIPPRRIGRSRSPTSSPTSTMIRSTTTGSASPSRAGYGHSAKDHRNDLPQVVIAMAVTRDGIPVRCWTFPGNESDQRIIRTVKDDLGAWNLRRMVWVADRGFASAANRAYLQRGGGHYIHAEKLRHTNTEAAAALARPGRYRTVAGNLQVKQVWVSPGGGSDDGTRTERFVVCHNPAAAARDAAVRGRLIKQLEALIEGSDAWRTLRHELDRMHLVTLPTADGRVAHRPATTNSQKTILDALQLPEPPQYLDFTTASS